jgi:hypothetical protein
MDKKTIIITLAVICAASIGGYEYWKYEDTKNREAAHQAAQDSLVLELATDPAIEYGDKIDDPEALALSYVTDSYGDVTVANAEDIDSSKLGTVTLTYTVSTKDTYGVEVYDTKDLTVTVQDTTAPEIMLAADTVSIQEGSDFDPLANVTEVKDPVDGDLDKEMLTVNNPVDTAAPGSYTVSLSAADESGNTSDVSYAVTVIPKPVVKKTTTVAASASSGSDYSSNAATEGTETYSGTTGATNLTGANIDSSDSSSDIGVSEINFDSFENAMQNLYNKGMEHYGEGVAWDAGLTSDGDVLWGQDW